MQLNESRLFDYDDFTVSFAKRQDVGPEWNLGTWDSNHHEIDCHRLYFRTDSDGGVAKLHLAEGSIELVAGRVYFMPAYSILRSEIDTHMNKNYIHFRSHSLYLSLHRFLSGRYSVPSGEHTQALFDTVIENYTDHSINAQMKVRGAMNLLLADFFSELATNRQQLARFEPVLLYIEEHYREPLMLSQLATLMGVSTTYFSNSFKEVFRISPKQYILNKRLARSRQLLLETDLSIREIAWEVGFENENYFSEFFSSKIGQSALKYRQGMSLKR